MLMATREKLSIAWSHRILLAEAAPTHTRMFDDAAHSRHLAIVMLSLCPFKYTT
jgi:hypothetical protein